MGGFPFTRCYHAQEQSNRPVRTQYALALCGALALSACSSKYAAVPARLDLAPYGRIAIVAFSTEQTNSGMSTLATQRFAEALCWPVSRVSSCWSLTAADSSLKSFAADADAAAMALALGREKNVPAVFVGQLKVSGVKPRGNLSASGMNVRAAVSAELTVRLLSTKTGGTMWRSSSAANGTVGRLALSGALPSVAMRDKEEAYGEVVGQLVTNVTRDLRPYLGQAIASSQPGHQHQPVPEAPSAVPALACLTGRWRRREKLGVSGCSRTFDQRRRQASGAQEMLRLAARRSQRMSLQDIGRLLREG